MRVDDGDNALPNPVSMAATTALPARSSSRIRSKISTLLIDRHTDGQNDARDAGQRQNRAEVRRAPRSE